MKRILLLFAISVLSFPACTSSRPSGRDWNAVIAAYRDDGRTADYQKLSLLNLALAETGQLVDKVFHYTQAGSDGIFPTWSMTVESGKLLSDIYWSMGHIAYAQRMAMEANTLSEGDYDPAMMLRLTETNLVFGAYDVAGKYIGILEKDRLFHKTAAAYRKFLYDDDAVESDPVLGPKRRCIPAEDHISLLGGIEEDMKRIIRTNPAHTITADYLGTIYLLDCDMEAFKAFVDEFYGTEALPALHGAFAEAVCMMSEVYHGYWKTVGVDRKVYNRYLDFTKRIGTGVSMDRFKDTFWYYIMRVNSL